MTIQSQNQIRTQRSITTTTTTTISATAAINNALPEAKPCQMISTSKTTKAETKAKAKQSKQCRLMRAQSNVARAHASASHSSKVF
jgi:hypothetical protein